MSLLSEIQASAVDAREPITALLRRCKILAARLKHAEFKAWVENELSGYNTKESIPEYRIYVVGCKGYFAGPYGSGMKNADIPKSAIPKEVRDELFTSYFAQPVAAIESLIQDSEGGTVQGPWPPEVTAIVGERIYQGMNCLQAWKVIPVNGLVAALDIIRSKVLNFVLELEAESPEAGDSPQSAPVVSNERITQIFNTYITGKVQNVATGSTNVSQNATAETNDKLFDQLIANIMAVNGRKDEKDELAGIVEEMKASQGKETFRSHYQSFMSALADHFQVFGPVIAPFLPALVEILP
ncbi:AbiTii domain-containing protein [Candidatus Thiosymbion oneisti]|uniref:AbiTii domain-containing protein n=1 Tax=Candidatus Thiosymbion oneisti TaxID=589554 RepID=UPI000B7CE2A7|nr:hypothetical protein [Candidatus Thiosymbion oneisti]